MHVCHISISLHDAQICHEKFELFWKEDDDNWMFRGVVRDDNNKLAHYNCVPHPNSTSTTKTAATTATMVKA